MHDNLPHDGRFRRHGLIIKNIKFLRTYIDTHSMHTQHSLRRGALSRSMWGSLALAPISKVCIHVFEQLLNLTINYKLLHIIVTIFTGSHIGGVH